jgi:hypothetical protein
VFKFGPIHCPRITTNTELINMICFCSHSPFSFESSIRTEHVKLQVGAMLIQQQFILILTFCYSLDYNISLVGPYDHSSYS